MASQTAAAPGGNGASPQLATRMDVGRPREAAPTTATTPTDVRRHGFPQRGLDVVASSPLFEGRFGRMFRNLPVHEHSEDALTLLARTMIQAAELDKPLGTDDDDENPSIPAGYTYLGQFIDHDLTFDPASSLQRQNDPDALVDFRTPRFDLDSMYGRGPSDQPYLYDTDGLHLLTGDLVDTGDSPFAGPDLPRNRLPDRADGKRQGRALLGDPRNDENLIVSQLHRTFLRFHNRVIDHLQADPKLAALDPDDLFKEAQRLVRWHYQWVVVHDFLCRICGQAVVDNILGSDNGDYVVGRQVSADGVNPGGLADGQPARVTRPRLLFYQYKKDPFIPVEFSVAAYRFGHSMVRPSYNFNEFVKGITAQARQNDPNAPVRTPIFGPDDANQFANLNGFRPLPPKWGFQWKFFFSGLGDADDGTVLPQPSYKIDTSLVNPLGTLPPQVATNPSSLAERNLKRGLHFDLPAGQTVARAMGITPRTDAQLGLDDAGLRKRLQDSEIDDVADEAIAAAVADFAGQAPLWFYILKEAETVGGAHRLGPVGGRIVAEVLIGILAGDPLSFLNVEPAWQPTLLPSGATSFAMPELIRVAQGDDLS